MSLVQFDHFCSSSGYIAPEIVRFTGDELYTEKVRCTFRPRQQNSSLIF